MTQRWQKQTAIFIAGQTATMLGSMLVQFAISWHITLTTKSGMMLTISTLCGFLPQVLISLFAGVWADRFSRKKMIMFADGAIAAATLVLAVLFLLGYEQLWLLFVISVIRSFGQGVQSPAVSALLPDLVPQEKLMRVNGIHSGIQSAMMLIAPLAAGSLYELMRLRAIFWVDVITAVIGISLMLTLRIERKEPPAAEQHVFREMLDGMRYVAGTKWLRQFLIIYAAYVLMFGPVMFLTPLMVARSFGDESWRLMAHEIAFSAGAIVGGVISSVFADKFKNKVILVLMGCLVFGLGTGIMGFSKGFWFYLGVMALLGLTMPFVNTGSMTVLQIRVEPEKMGRVFGMATIISSGLMPLSMAVFGPVSDRASVELLLVITGVLMAGISLFGLRLRDMVAVGKPAEAGEG